MLRSCINIAVMHITNRLLEAACDKQLNIQHPTDGCPWPSLAPHSQLMVCNTAAAARLQANIRRYYVYALKHAQELAEQVKMAASVSGKAGVEIQEHVEMMLLDVFLEGLFEIDLRRVNSEEVRIGHFAVVGC